MILIFFLQTCITKICFLTSLPSLFWIGFYINRAMALYIILLEYVVDIVVLKYSKILTSLAKLAVVVSLDFYFGTHPSSSHVTSSIHGLVFSIGGSIIGFHFLTDCINSKTLFLHLASSFILFLPCFSFLRSWRVIRSWLFCHFFIRFLADFRHCISIT